MVYIDGPDSTRRPTSWELFKWWLADFRDTSWRCQFGWHTYGPTKYRHTQGFNIAWRLVDATEVYRNCVRCGKYQGETRADSV